MRNRLCVALLALLIGGCAGSQDEREREATQRQLRAIDAESRLMRELRQPGSPPYYREHQRELDEEARELQAERAR